MPIYSYRCELCGDEFDSERVYEARNEVEPCRVEGCPGLAVYVMSAPLIGTGRVRGDKRLIFDERQVTSELGPRWRDAGTTGREGGAGAADRKFLDMRQRKAV